MNILITGGTGFLGSYLARELASNNAIRIVSRGEMKGYLTSEDLERFKFTECDIRNKRALSDALSPDIDLVIHCAGKISIQNSGRCPGDIIETNVNSTIHLIEAMIDKGIQRLLFCSSMTVYGLENVSPVKEDGVLKPIHFYGLSKKWAEEAIMRYTQKGLIKALIIRYPGLYGYPRGSGYIFNISKKLLRKEPIDINTQGLKFWETLNIKDAVEITKKILDIWQGEEACDVINCSYGRETDFVGTAFLLKEILNSRSVIKAREPLDYVKFYIDNTKLKSLIEFNYNFEEGLRIFLNEHKEWIQK
ncbi:NAD-dependent epimerase/dehydratase family protein [Candidatus Omnitrophota bacterium]